MSNTFRTIALAPSPDWSAFLSQLDTTARGELSLPDSDGKYVLHHVVASNGPFNVVKKVCEAFPEAANLRTKVGHLPLDYALNADPQDSLVVDLLSATMSSFLRRPSLLESQIATVQQTELHALCVFKHTAASSRLSSHPAEASVQDKDGNLPLHIACDHGAPFQLVFSLLDAFPSGAKSANSKGQVPLHFAAGRNNARADVVRALRAVAPGAVDKRDFEGDTPKDKAIKAFAGADVIALLG